MSRGGHVASKRNIVATRQAPDKLVGPTTEEAMGVDAAMWDKGYALYPPSDE